MILIGLVGEKGSGKDTFSKYLEGFTNKTVEHIRFSDLLKNTLEIWDLPESRSNLQKLAQVLEEFGEGTVAHGLLKKIKSSSAEIIILDGIRWMPDLALLNQFTAHKLVYITADPKLRFERLKQRGEKIGESEMNYEQFLEEEKAPNELLIPEIGAKADFKIANNGSIEEFKEKIKEFANSDITD